MDKATKARFDAIARMGCIVCRLYYGVYSPACLHHLTGIKYRSTGKKASDAHVIPLCHRHHQGQDGIHAIGMRAWEKRFGTQQELLSMVNETPIGLG